MKIRTGLLISICLAAAMMVRPVAAKTASGVITSDTTWSGTITVTGDVMVSSGVLTIAPGTVIKFAETNDNIVFGTLDKIRLVAMLQGGIQAVGTPYNRITFTTVSTAPEPGLWGKIQIIANADRSQFAYCNFLYGKDGIDVSNPTGYTGTSSVSVSYCSFQHLSNLPLHCYQGSEMTVDHCLIEDCLWGVFAERASDISVTYSYFNGVANAVLVSGLESDTCHALIDHVTIYDADMSRDPSPRWWSGYGIFFTGTIGYCQGKVTNSIFDECDLAGLDRNGWNIDYGYNCFGIGVPFKVEGDSLAPTDINADPGFYDPGRDFAIFWGPCAGTASDGLNRGAWQEGDTWPYHQATDIRGFNRTDRMAEPLLEMAPNPFTSSTRIRIPDQTGPATVHIFDTAGNAVVSVNGIPAAQGFAWDGRDDNGRRLQTGTYICTVETASGRVTGRIILTY